MQTPHLRQAAPADAVALRDLERAASLASLETLFPPERYPYPDEGVLGRWQAELLDPEVRTLVGEDEDGLTVLVAFDAETLWHLAVRPDRWRDGLGRAAVDAAVTSLGPRRLWCLCDNHGARRFYRRLGWQPTGRSRPTPWPPHPVELELTRP